MNIFHREGKVDQRFKIPVSSLPEENIRDTIGAGDSFIAGFLLSLTRNHDLKTCVMSGVGEFH